MRMSFVLGAAAVAVVLAASDTERAHRTATAVLDSAWSLSGVVSRTYARNERPKRKAKVQRVAQKSAKRSRKQPTRIAQAKRGKKRNLAAGYRTLCVRLCDGFYFPVSGAANPEEFLRDEQICRSSCASPAKLFVYENKGGSPDTMTDLEGTHYGTLATAYQYRVRYESSCSCASAAPWTEASAKRHQLYALNEQAAQGDLAADLARVPLASAVRAGETVARARTGADLVVASVPKLQAIAQAQRELNRKVATARQEITVRKGRPIRTAALQARHAGKSRRSTRAAAAQRRVQVAQRPARIRLSESRTVVYVHR